jgi:hypothetical protein
MSRPTLWHSQMIRASPLSANRLGVKEYAAADIDVARLPVLGDRRGEDCRVAICSKSSGPVVPPSRRTPRARAREREPASAFEETGSIREVGNSRVFA